MSDARDWLSFLGTCPPKSFRLRTVTLQPGETVGYQAADWVDTLVVVEVGALEVECRSGACASFAEGAILVFTELEPSSIRNGGNGPVVLSALSRIVTP